jgi:integrase
LFKLKKEKLNLFINTNYKNKMRKLTLPKKDRIAGLYLFCNKINCKKYYENDAAVKCKCNKLVYKYKVHIPGLKNKYKTKNLIADNIDDALIECRAFKKELINNSFQKIKIEEGRQIPVLLMDCIAAFMDYLNNVDVPFHSQRIRPRQTIRAYERFLEFFLFSLKENDIDASILKFTDINQKMVGFACQFGLDIKKMRNKTYNNYTSSLKSFAKYIIEKYDLNIKNPFASIKQKKVVPIVKSASIDEFLSLIEIVKPENGRATKKNGKKKNYYREWIKDAYWLGVLTGGRREEVVKLQWNGIKLTKSGELSHIEINHFKINRANSDTVSETEYAIKKFPMNEDLFYLLIKLGYDKFKDTDKFILAPDETISRIAIMNKITDSFSHFFKQLNTGEVKNFKHLRKTYSTAQYLIHGDNTHKVTEHGDMAIILKHYIDPNVVLEARREEAKRYGRLF